MQERMAPTRGRGTPYWLGYQRLRLDSSESRRHQQREARLWQLRRTEELSRSCAPLPPYLKKALVRIIKCPGDLPPPL